MNAVNELLASPAFWLAAVALSLALVPAVLFAVNLPVFRPPPKAGRSGTGEGGPPAVSVLIPARDEEDVIERARTMDDTTLQQFLVSVRD